MKWLTQLCVFLVVALIRSGSFAAPAVTNLPENRILLFNDYTASNTAVVLNQPWTLHEGPALSGAPLVRALLPGTNHFHRTGWQIRSSRNGSSFYNSGFAIPPRSPYVTPTYPAVATNLAANLRYDGGALIESPVMTNGVGTLYFEAVNNQTAYPGQLNVEVATSMVNVTSGTIVPTVLPGSTNNLNYVWQTNAVIALNAVTSNDFVRFAGAMNIRCPAKVRVLRTGELNPSVSNPDSAFAVVDNIRVSPPPTDVRVYNESAFSQAGNYYIRCFVDNADTNAPTDSRTVTAYYRWTNLAPPGNETNSIVLSPVGAVDPNGNGVQYEAVLPVQPLGGSLEYFIVCEFGGYMYQSPDYTGLNYSGYAAENRSPFVVAVQTQALAGANLYMLTVNSGSGGGAYTNGQQILITASNITGMTFARWTGATQRVDSATSPATTVNMPDYDIELTATYTTNSYTLTVTGGSGSGSYAYGQVVPIEAPQLAGQVFDRWTGATQYVDNVLSSNTVVTIPDGNVSLTATYLPAYSLTVNSGSGDGSFTNNAVVVITADLPPANMIFDRWTGSTSTVANVTSSVTTVTMPASNIVLTASYVNVFTLNVGSGSGGGIFREGTQVTITADPPAGGTRFDRWTGDTATVDSVTSSVTTVIMPAADVNLTATYVNIFLLTVGSGSGGGYFTSGQVVPVTANSPATGQAFAQWTGATQYVVNAFAAATSVNMPAAPITITATYSNLLYTLTVNGGSGGGVYPYGQVVPISASVPGDKTFSRWTGDTAHVGNATSQNTTVTMPVTAVTLSALLSSQTATLPDGRFLHFNDYSFSNTAVVTDQPWVLHEGPPLSGAPQLKALLPGTNHFHKTGWKLFSCRTGAAYVGNYSIPPREPYVFPVYPVIASNLAANLRYEPGAMIESPVFTNGVGSVYFEAINNVAATPGQLTVDIATNMWDTDNLVEVPGVVSPLPPNRQYLWHTLDVLDLSAASSNDFTRYQRAVNYRGLAILQFRRTGELSTGISNPDSAFIVIDNIRVSIPPSDIGIVKTEAPFEPGYPSVGTNLTVRCWISNTDPTVPTDSRMPRVVYRWRFLNQQVQPWKTNDMTYVEETGDGNGNDEIYKADLSLSPFSEVGDLEYYFICDFLGYLYQSPDYTGMRYTYPSENLSPRFLRGGAEGEYKVRLRPYASQYGKLFAELAQFSEPIEMSLVGTREWRAMVPLAGTGITNLIWRFKGVNEYSPGTGVYAAGVTSYWGGVSGVTDGHVPYGGICVQTNASGSLSVLVDEKSNYVLLTFNTDTLQYLATRGEYQNFNLWPAPPTYFSESNGQDPKHSFLNTFDTWPLSGGGYFLQAFAGYPAQTNVVVRDPFFTMNLEFVAGSAAYIIERPVVDFTVNAPDMSEPQKFRNVALRLRGGDGSLGLGYIHNRVATLPDGIMDITFKARVSQTSDRYDICYYRNGFTNLNYVVRARGRCANLAELSPWRPFVSLIGYYRDPDNFYEYRVTMTNHPSDTTGTFVDRRIIHQLNKWQNGVMKQMTSLVVQDTTSAPLVDAITDSLPLELCIFNEGGGTRIRCRYPDGGAESEKINILDSSSPHTGGTFGFVSSDCLSGLSNVRTQGTTSTSPYGTGTETVVLRQDSDDNLNADVQNWYMPAGKYVAKANTVPKGIYSVIPTIPIGIYKQPTEFGSDIEPMGPGSIDPGGHPYWQTHQTVTVSSYNYQTFTVPFNTWEAQFFMLQVSDGKADVTVDEVKVSSWHGGDNGEDNGAGFDWDWLATESWVATNTTTKTVSVYLDHSRGDPLYEQAIRSLKLDTGLGLMEFDYQVRRAPAKLTVQYATANDETDWREVRSFVHTNVTGWLHATAYLGTNVPGFFRLLNAREGIYTNAFVEIDNVTVWDEPTLTNNAWRAYNVKISSNDTNRVTLDETKACFLNNDPYLEASPPQTEFYPYLKSPELPKGFGKITFDARAYTNQAATLYLYATTSGWNAPDTNWFQVATFENITNSLYKLFSFEPVDGRDYNAVRLGTKTGPSDRRVCIDNVTISEPVLPGFDIVNVRLMDYVSGVTYQSNEQPGEGEDVHVEARIDNIQMIPSNIVMYVKYYVGTNVWGVDNWPASEVVTKVMTNNVPGDPTLYHTVPDGTAGFSPSLTGGILGQNRDLVVQYCVVAEYMGGIQLNTRQETFVNPDWYYPVDLNVTYAARGWSPYYIVYGVPRNAVWINEVNAVDYRIVGGVQQYGIWDHMYIEIAVPAWLDLTGWGVDLVKYDNSVRTVMIPAGLPEQTPVVNGYAFFVIADAGPFDPRVPALPKTDMEVVGLKNNMPRLAAGGLRLRRPMGMYEQHAAYDWDSSWGGDHDGTNWVAKEPSHRFMYVGRESDGGSLGVTNETGKAFTDWTFPMDWTPGAPNVGQNVPGQVKPGAQYVYVNSLLNSDKATQNGKRVRNYTLKMQKGMGTNITYRTDPWYRLYSVKKDEVEQLPSLGTETNFSLALPNLQTNVGVNVNVQLRQDIYDQNLDADVLNWVLGFSDGELIPMYYNNRLLTLTDQYWLDAWPTQTNTFDLVMTRMNIDSETNLQLTVSMNLNDANLATFQGPAVLKLQAKSQLLDTEWTMVAQYSLTAASFDSNHVCRVVVPNPFSYVLAGWDPQNIFFRWLIEQSDPRVTIQVLKNQP